MTRKRDPERRRREIIDAAVEVIADVGTGRATHRAIAERAGVPLGSTTYYFPTLDDLVAAALERVAESSTRAARRLAAPISKPPTTWRRSWPS